MQQKLLHFVMMMMMQTCLFVSGVFGFLRGIKNTVVPVSSCFPWRLLRALSLS
jgi:exonuclease I